MPDGRQKREPHRADALTRPYKLSPVTIAFGAIVTAGLLLLLGFGIARESRHGPGADVVAPVREYSVASPPTPESRRYPGYAGAESRSLVFVDRDGTVRDATSDHRDFHSPRFSPNGRLVLVDFPDAFGRDAWVLAVGRGVMLRATFARDAHDATWMPNGQYITFTSYRSGSLGIYRTRPTSDSPPDSLLASPQLDYTGSWLPDGATLVTTARNLMPGSRADIALVENGRIIPLVSDQFDTHSPAVSPNGEWLAFVSNRSGRSEIYVRRMRTNGPDVRISESGGREPVWSRDNRELFYIASPDRPPMLMSVTGDGLASFDITAKRPLFAVGDMVPARDPHANYDVSPDGKTFVMVLRTASTAR
jgi:dipeptidyl aminopeptidase/acylaminoacyl peptidase